MVPFPGAARPVPPRSRFPGPAQAGAIHRRLCAVTVQRRPFLHLLAEPVLPGAWRAGHTCGIPVPSGTGTLSLPGRLFLSGRLAVRLPCLVPAVPLHSRPAFEATE